jgi:phage gp36-like protein
MNFLTNQDLYAVITPDALSEISAASATSLETAEEFAKSQVETYINTKYDTNAVFAATSTARHKTIVMCMVDLCLYHLHSGLAGRNIPELRRMRYEDAIKTLRDINKGTLAPKGLPQPDDDADDNTPGIWGIIHSQTKFNSEY